MNQEEVRKMLKDFRRLRSEIVDRSDFIIAMFETALKSHTPSPTPDPSPEQLTYQEFGIRLTVDDYTGSAELSPHQSGVSLFAESDKRPSARTGKSIRRKLPSEQVQSHISIRTMPSILRNKRASQPDTRGLAKFMDKRAEGNFSTAPRRESKTRDDVKRVQKQASENSDNDSSSPLKMAMVSMGAAKFPVTSSHSFTSPDSSKSSNEIFARLKQEPILVPLRDISPDQQPSGSVALSTTRSIYGQVSKTIEASQDRSSDSNNSATSRGTSALSFQIEENNSNPVSPSLEVPSSFAPSRSLLRDPSKMSTISRSPKYVQVPTKPAEQRVAIPPPAPPAPTPPPPNSVIANIFLLPAYDHKGRRVTTEQLSAFGTYNDEYALMNVDQLSLWITVIYAVDSIITVFTPRLVEGDFTFDFVEYEKARPTLAVWVEEYFRQTVFIEIFTLIPFAIFFHSALDYELFLLIPLIRVYKLIEHLRNCPAITNLAWRIDDLAAAPISKIIPIVAGIFLFAHFNACSIYLMGRVTGFIGWDSMCPLYNSASIKELYVWTFYKAIGNIFPTSLNPWTMAEQIVSLVYIILAAIVYAVFLGSISSAVMAFNPSGRLFNQKIGELRDYIRWKDLSKETETKLLSYYESRYRGKYFEEDAVLADFNDSLKAEILLHNTRKLIERVPFLKRSEDDGRDELFIGRIAGALHSYNYIPGDYVTKQGDSGSDMYFILSGKADVYVNNNRVVTLSAGTYFGGKHMSRSVCFIRYS
ncbi:Potassium voltage-gated channel sub H member 7 [Chytriomyces hyalinus]|nr:Potassium voltage-gated channel sub H member 7 [Chytriomyces hyalinus]